MFTQFFLQLLIAVTVLSGAPQPMLVSTRLCSPFTRWAAATRRQKVPAAQPGPTPFPPLWGFLPQPNGPYCSPGCLTKCGVVRSGIKVGGEGTPALKVPVLWPRLLARLGWESAEGETLSRSCRQSSKNTKCGGRSSCGVGIVGGGKASVALSPGWAAWGVQRGLWLGGAAHRPGPSRGQNGGGPLFPRRPPPSARGKGAREPPAAPPGGGPGRGGAGRGGRGCRRRCRLHWWGGGGIGRPRR